MKKDSKTLHLLIIPSWMPTPGDPAAGAFIIEQTIALAQERDFQIGMIYYGSQLTPDAKARFQKAGVQSMYTRGPRIPKVHPWLIGLWFKAYVRLYKKYSKKFGTPDCIHAHSYIAGFAARYLSEKFRIPFVLTEHSTNFLKGTIRKSHEREVKLTLQSAAKVIAVGNVLRDALKNWTNREVVCIPNCYDPSVFYCDPQEKKNTHFTIVCIAALIPHKRHHLLLEAFNWVRAQGHDIRLVIVGSGPDEDQLRKYAQAEKLSLFIDWTDYLAPEGIATLLRKSHVLVSLSSVETFGVTVVEAMACGIPVLCTSSGGPEEYVQEGQGIILPPDATYDTIGNALVWLKEHYAQYNADSISQSAKARFSRPAVIPQLRTMYSEVVESTR